eukprot:6502203-Prymnesium_polylepis.1
MWEREARLNHRLEPGCPELACPCVSCSSSSSSSHVTQTTGQSPCCIFERKVSENVTAPLAPRTRGGLWPMMRPGA